MISFFMDIIKIICKCCKLWIKDFYDDYLGLLKWIIKRSKNFSESEVKGL